MLSAREQALLAAVFVTALSRLLVPPQLVLLASTAVTIALASLPAFSVPRALVDAGMAIGTALLYVFFASAGATAALLSTGFSPAVLGFLVVLYLVHFAVVIGFALSPSSSATLPEALVASSASIGNPAPIRPWSSRYSPMPATQPFLAK